MNNNLYARDDVVMSLALKLANMKGDADPPVSQIEHIVALLEAISQLTIAGLMRSEFTGDKAREYKSVVTFALRSAADQIDGNDEALA